MLPCSAWRKEGVGGGNPPCRGYKYPTVEVVKRPIPPVCCREAILLLVFVSPARHNMEFLFVSAGGRVPKIQRRVRERLTLPWRGDPKQAGSPILSVRRRAHFAGICEIYGFAVVRKWVLTWLYNGSIHYATE